jgi:hypothetical protein
LKASTTSPLPASPAFRLRTRTLLSASVRMRSTALQSPPRTSRLASAKVAKEHVVPAGRSSGSQKL